MTMARSRRTSTRKTKWMMKNRKNLMNKMKTSSTMIRLLMKSSRVKAKTKMTMKKSTLRTP